MEPGVHPRRHPGTQPARSQPPTTKWAPDSLGGPSRKIEARPGSPECHLLNISGAAELYVRTGMVDVAVDAYMSGRTAGANGLELLTPLFETSGRVFARPGWQSEPKDITRALEVLADIN
ncbi:hypothetical protein [Streptomyces sp. NPDC017202]|uniref:hypothetical protein n=1 Tax=Streptomyces sp. NPDC017202 TaxID=3364981 RepID=UPI00379E5296